jgi:hypothetical protein
MTSERATAANPSLAAIAKTLEARGVRTPACRASWQAVQVSRISATATELEARGIRMPGPWLAACPYGAPMSVHVALFPGEPEVELAIAVKQDACFFVVDCANHVH